MFWKRKARASPQPERNASLPAEKSTQPVQVFNIPDEHAAVWEKLEAFPIDDPQAEFPLSKRLASEQEWTHEYALRVVEEYRKFLFLCMVAPHMVTPSLRVDEAWHLHLLYTKSYWEGLCVRTLGRLIHHEPSRGGKQEEEQFSDLYDRTLALYERYFGEPPEDIWGRRQGEKRKPGNCRAVRGPAPGETMPESERELLAMIERAAQRLKEQQS
jgi:hypothetical protein